MNRLERITSRKHPGAVFFKVAGTHDDFVCKFYPGHEAAAADYERMANTMPLSVKHTKADGTPVAYEWTFGHLMAVQDAATLSGGDIRHEGRVVVTEEVIVDDGDVHMHFEPGDVLEMWHSHA